MHTEMLFFIYLLSGLVLGGLLGWFITRIRFAQQAIDKSEVEEKYVAKNQFDQLQRQFEEQSDLLRQKELEIRQSEKLLAAEEEKTRNLQNRLERQIQDFQEQQKQSVLTFETVANKLLEEKTRQFSHHNQSRLDDILKPLKEKIKEFEEGIERKFMEDAKEKLSLKLAIEQLQQLNTQLSQDANRLVNALRGDVKMQGNWGEFQLELLLQKAGLESDLHYHSQANFKDEAGRDKRPDFIINLPDDKHLVIDSKVSLVAYERYFDSEDPEEQKQHLKAHVDSIRQHIQGLSEKQYQDLYQINSPDYLLLYIPIEPAFTLALQDDKDIFLHALDRNIVLVTSSTLLATMRTVSFIWTQEKQKKSVLEIARQSGLLYDRFVNFVKDLQEVGQRLDQSQNAYHNAMNKLANGKRYGDTLIGRAEKIKELGARASKKLPQELLPDSRETDNHLPDNQAE